MVKKRRSVRTPGRLETASARSVDQLGVRAPAGLVVGLNHSSTGERRPHHRVQVELERPAVLGPPSRLEVREVDGGDGVHEIGAADDESACVRAVEVLGAEADEIRSSAVKRRMLSGG